ncbi:MAG: hypothetical protein SPL37_03115 [Prevotella sp.]|jgi:hypothetical protein|nr:hypothetical protein [Prevotella sp.]
MAAIEFDILQYMSGLTGFTFDKAVLTRIALERGVDQVTAYAQLTKRQRDLITADLLLTAYLSPTVWASFDQAHGSFKKGVGSQTMYNKEEIYNYLYNIYSQYEDEKLEELPDNSAHVFFRNDI